jgi:hypothetical protein
MRDAAPDADAETSDPTGRVDAGAGSATGRGAHDSDVAGVAAAAAAAAEGRLSMDEFVALVVGAAPPLSPTQVQRLRRILLPEP